MGMNTIEAEPRNAGYERLGRLMVRSRGVIIVAVLGLVIAMGLSAARNTAVDTSVEAFVKSDSEARVVLDEYRRDFGRDSMFFVLIKADVFSEDALQRLKTLHVELEGLKLDNPPAASPSEATVVEPETDDEFGDFGDDEGWGDALEGSVIDQVTSLINARRTRAAGDGIEVVKLLDPFPENLDLAALRRDVTADKTLVGQVVNEAGTHAVIGVRTIALTEREKAEVYRLIQGIAARHAGPDFTLFVGGMPALNSALNELLMRDLSVMFTVSLVIMFLVLTFLFRHPIAVLTPLFVVVASGIVTIGTLATLGIPLTMMTNILPAFLVCVGVGHSVHLISVYRDSMAFFDDTEEAIVHAVATTGVPIFYTSLTTFVGLLSFHFASVDAIREMGYAGAFAIMVVFVLSITLLPAMLSFNRSSLMGRAKRGDKDFIDRFLGVAIRASAAPDDDGVGPEPEVGRRRRRLSLIVMVLLMIGGVSGASILGVYHNPLSWIPESTPIKQAFDELDVEMGGTANVQIIVEGRPGKGIKELDTLKAMESLQQHVESYRHPEVGGLVGNTISVLDVVKETHSALTGGEAENYRLPDTDRGVSDMLFMFENAGPDELRRLAVNDLSRAQMTMRLRWMDATSYLDLTRHVSRGIETIMPEGVKARPTGSVYLLVSTIGELIFDLLRSFGVAFFVITLIMMVLFGSAKLGLIAMVPNLMPIIMIMGLMGITGIPIDMNNLLIASISIGIAVDDTVHLLHHYRVNYEQTHNVETSIHRAMEHSGRAMTSTTLILMLGFFTFMAGEMTNISRFGLLVGLTAVMALLIDVFFAPALLRTFYPRSSGENQTADDTALEIIDDPVS